MPRIVSPGLHTVMYTAVFACAPEWGCTFAWSQPKSRFSRSIASVSTTSAYSQPP